jgi:uncharacterized protein YidB (DUF937 family)
MLDNLLNLVKEHAGDAIINNPAIPNERNDEAVEVASSSIFDTLKGAVAGGNIGDIASMFSGGAGNAASSPLASVMHSGMVQNLMHKFGLDKGIAGTMASTMLPGILSNLVSKTNDPNDSSFDIKSIISKVAGGGAGGFDIGSILSQFTGGGNTQQQPQAGGGGIMETISNLFK